MIFTSAFGLSEYQKSMKTHVHLAIDSICIISFFKKTYIAEFAYVDMGKVKKIKNKK